ncbi:MAG: phosphotransferase [Actinomycetota bacterium]
MPHRASIQARFPGLKIRTVAPIGDGWTCDTYEVNGEWIVQVPRTAHAAERLRVQVALLPELAREVPAPIPLPASVSLEDDPPMMAYRRLPGAACDVAPGGIWPERLGRFLYALHSVPPEFVGMRTVRPAVVRARQRDVCSALAAQVLPFLDGLDRADAERMLASYLDEDDLWIFAPCLTHGDLGPEHVLVGADGDLAGIIDWEEAAIGDPAWDFAWWLHEMPDQAGRALAAYGGPPDRRFHDRARFTYALMPWHEVAFGLEDAQPAFVRSGLDGVRRRLPRTA